MEIQLKCKESSKNFKRGRVYTGRVKETYKGTYYIVKGENGNNNLCKAERFEPVIEEVPASSTKELVPAGTVIYNVDLSLGQRLKAICSLGLKKGDAVTMWFNDGQRATVNIDRVGFMRRQTVNNGYIDRFYIEDLNGQCWNLYETRTIRLDYRNPKSTKVLTDSLKQLHYTMDYHLRRENKGNQTIVDEVKEVLRKPKKATPNKFQTNKEIIEEYAIAEGYSLGCWDKALDNFSLGNIKYLGGLLRFGDCTDVIINHELSKVVVSIDIVDNEVDFALYSKEDYINMFGAEKFEEYSHCW